MMQRLIIFSSTIVGTYLAISLPVFSQIISDHTANTAVSGNCQTSCEINGGTISGQNLFHLDPSALFFNQMGQIGSIVLEGANLTVSEGKNLIALGM